MEKLYLLNIEKLLIPVNLTNLIWCYKTSYV